MAQAPDVMQQLLTNTQVYWSANMMKCTNSWKSYFSVKVIKLENLPIIIEVHKADP